ncbi:glycosyltransferase family 2 protein [Staphylothermus hellenicus]|uniref:Glycosyl transferase family 2 n=1 Tax=Staphylothermus hellenicus (strain DSM 12710 / JCM 10830 / BK20S6-10-b1 / P8) TaxID=591019 RepID=D7D8B1_STAHD|nr:glycosyltransferase family 2 protein [Staphylothermus hellenicus]ADI32007.1 glycosyl transferase family 2 [Staphylothermus hellenicus DSM 12710]
MLDEEISVVVVTYNSSSYIIPCLKSILNSRNTALKEVIIIDNNSADNTLGLVKKHFGNDPRVKVVSLHRNMGFPYACNVGVRLARSRYVVLMNPDVVVDPYCFARLAEFLSRNSDVVAVQPKLLHPAGYIDGVGGVMDVLGHGFHLGMYEKDTGQYERPREILYACFACAMVKRDVYLRLGGMDPRFFLYSEDLDFGWRCWLAGYRVMYVPGAIAYHVGQHATKKLPYHAIYFGRRNRLYTVFTNYPLFLGIIASIILLALYIGLGFYSMIIVRDKVEARLVLRIIVKFLKDLKYLVMKRKRIIRRRSFLEFIRKSLISTQLVGLKLYLAKLYRKQLAME